jgi:hypothetical protein
MGITCIATDCKQDESQRSNCHYPVKVCGLGMIRWSGREGENGLEMARQREFGGKEGLLLTPRSQKTTRRSAEETATSTSVLPSIS